jgi:hypothetical protein
MDTVVTFIIGIWLLILFSLSAWFICLGILSILSYFIRWIFIKIVLYYRYLNYNPNDDNSINSNNNNNLINNGIDGIAINLQPVSEYIEEKEERKDNKINIGIINNANI